MSGVIVLAPAPVFIDSDKQTVHANATVTAGGAQVYTDFGTRLLVLVINITQAPTGIAPTLQYELQEVDPGDETTPVGSSVMSVAFSGVGQQIIELPLTLTGSVKVSWAVTGSFTGVYATLLAKITTTSSGVDSSGEEHPLLVDASGRTIIIDAQGAAVEAGKSSTVDPITGVQTSNWQNSTPPTSAVLSNTTPSYPSLGGLFQFAAPTGAETDYALFGYQVPAGWQLWVTAVRITTQLLGVRSSTLPTVLQWGLAANSSAASLGTGPPHPPVFTPLGIQFAPKSAPLGPLDPGTVEYEPATPLVVSPTRFFHVVLRCPVGNPTVGQILRGTVAVEGYFQ
jgi:hypothetical protein